MAYFPKHTDKKECKDSCNNKMVLKDPPTVHVDDYFILPSLHNLTESDKFRTGTFFHGGMVFPDQPKINLKNYKKEEDGIFQICRQCNKKCLVGSTEYFDNFDEPLDDICIKCFSGREPVEEDKLIKKANLVKKISDFIANNHISDEFSSTITKEENSIPKMNWSKRSLFCDATITSIGKSIDPKRQDLSQFYSSQKNKERIRTILEDRIHNKVVVKEKENIVD